MSCCRLGHNGDKDEERFPEYLRLLRDYDICKLAKNDDTKEVPCPKAVAVYNDVMGQVDRLDQTRQLIDGCSSRKRKGRPASFQEKKCVVPDGVRLTSVGNQMQMMVSNKDDVGNIVERDKKRGHATCEQNVMSSCALRHASHLFTWQIITKLNFFMAMNEWFLGKYSSYL
ncbi:piggyBac transposable element-derived protein 4 [Trichonephila clavipes]|nr:piggyBac transposable element-derived protein 4 [Trichonephila clavipes]